jgi:hypothetical protein
VSAWLNFAGIVIAAAISGYAAYMAGKAEKNSRPVANGFTNYVLTDLREIRKSLLDHLISHESVKNQVKLPDSGADCG